MPTTYQKIEPIGAGRLPAGDPADDKLEIEYGRGAGDPTTTHTEDNSE